MDMVVSTISMFDLKQSVYVVKDDKCTSYGTVPTLEVSDVIVKICNELDIKNVRLYGVHDFLQQFVYKIKEKNEDINVEVN